ncbi:MAG: nitroreductase family protein [Bacteroidales bacterium]|nr:nitroreductase family protein [Bacteroidales bacterium]
MKKQISLFLLSAAAILCGCSGRSETNLDSVNMENPVIEAIMARRSIRHYKDTPVDREILEKIALCGINAPNAMNHQDWEVRIIDSEDYFNGITEVMKKEMPSFVGDDDPRFRNAFRNATAAFAIACPDDESGMLMQNVGLMSENICLAAYSLGIGTCIMGGPVMVMNGCPEAKPFLDRLGFSEGYKLRVIIAAGYPDEEPEARPRDAGKIRFVE